MPATFGIVIQGPLVSGGWNCRENILRLLALPTDRSRFSFCLSTWRTEDTTLWENDERILVVKNDPPPGRDYHNRRKQIWTTLQGALALTKKNNLDYLVKIRTDQFIDLSAIVEYLQGLSEHLPSGCIVAPAMSRFIPFYVADFYFAGRTEAMVRYCRNILSWGETLVQNHIEIDFTLKHLQIELNRTIGTLSQRELFEPLFLYPYLRKNSSLYRRSWETWMELRPQFFEFFPGKIFRDMEWRGKLSLPQKDDFLPTFHFAEDAVATLEIGPCPYPEPSFGSLIGMKLIAWENLLANRWKFAPRELGLKFHLLLQRYQASINHRFPNTFQTIQC